MKTDEEYSYYLTYLNSRLLEGKITKGSLSLLKISSSSYEDFKYRYQNDELFQKRVIEMHRSENRDKKIDDIFDDFD
jgi:hypothetical protein